MRRKMWRSALGLAAAAVLSAGMAVTAEESPGTDAKEQVEDAFSRLYETQENSMMNALFGWDDLCDAMWKMPTQFVVRTDVWADREYEEWEGAGEVWLELDLDRKEFVIGMGTEDEESRIDGLFYMDGEKMKLKIPFLSEETWVLPYRDGIDGDLPENSFLAPYQGTVKTVCAGIAEFWDTVTDFDEAEERYQSYKERYEEACGNANSRAVESISVETGEDQTLTVDGEEQVCQGYQVTVNTEEVLDCLIRNMEFYRDDERYRDSYIRVMDVLSQTAQETEGTEEESQPEPEEQWEDTFNEVINFWEESREYLPEEVLINTYLCDGEIAKIESQIEVEGTKLEFLMELYGGAYRGQNCYAEIKVSGEDMEDPLLLRVGKESGYDEEEGYARYWVETVNPETGEQESYTDMNVSYDQASGFFQLELSDKEKDQEEERYETTGFITCTEIGRSIQVEINDLAGNAEGQEETIGITFGIDTDLGNVSSLQGPERNLLTATEEDIMEVAGKLEAMGDSLDSMELSE